MYPILTKAEAYSIANKKSGGAPSAKKRPYSQNEARVRTNTFVQKILTESRNIKVECTPNDKIVTKLTLHPSYLAKSYFPKELIKHFGLEFLGSKEIVSKPLVRVTRDQENSDDLVTSQLFIAGKRSDFDLMLSQLNLSNLNSEVVEDITKIEDLALFKGEEKFNDLDVNINSTEELIYEVVIYSESKHSTILKQFQEYISSIGGKVDTLNAQSVDGLTFIFVTIAGNRVKDLADFSFVRVVRSAPTLKLFPVPEYSEMDLPCTNEAKQSDTLKGYELSADVAVFDGGLPKSATLSNSCIRYFDLTNSKLENISYIRHGEHIASTIAYGDHGCNNSLNHHVNVDHYNVISAEDDAEGSTNLYRVLERIQSVLKQKQYRIVNICIGPSIPIPDDEPNLWTSVLDKLAENGQTLFVIACGNEGDCLDTLGARYARIQPPADMLNGIAVGAASTRCNKWDRAHYSCIGPGRKPGFIKPDILHFGGVNYGDKITIKRLEGNGYIQVHGTSFSAALITRQAALLDKFTNKQFNIATLRALLVQSAMPKGDQQLNGWGRVPSNVVDNLYCSKNSVTFVYQGRLDKKSGVRAAIPFTSGLPDELKVKITATLCYYSEVDVRSPGCYSKTGVTVVFKPNIDRLSENSIQPKPRAFFNQKNLYKTEHALRNDHHKWETCFKVSQGMKAKSLNQPVFDISFSERDEGQNYDSKAPLNYSLVVTVELKNYDQFNLYQSVIDRYPLLTPVEINIDTEIDIDSAV